MTEELHERELVVWGLPAAIECGSRFRLSVGVKCRAGCEPAGWQLEVRDHRESVVTQLVLDAVPASVTGTLHRHELELIAPASPGLHPWTISLGSDSGDHDSEGSVHKRRHASTGVRFNVRSVPPGEFRTTVIAVDRRNGRPIPGLRVVAHPYRGVTDARGTAELLLPAGDYRIFVSGQGFFPVRHDTRVQSDLSLRAELEPDRAPTDAELWS